MTNFTPSELAAHLKDGLLSFPVTAFTADGEFDEARYREHVAWQASYEVGGLFAAGGTGEGFSLTPEENARVVRAAVEASRPEVPVLGSAGGWTKNAVANAIAAEEAGAEGLLVLPPYLTETTQDGLFNHVSAIAEATKLPLIVYNRANAIYSAETVGRLADAHETFIGFKDALGNIEHLAKVTTLNGDRLFYLGGLPTAETYALPLLQMGMSTYSSAMFNFVPEFALEFYADVRRQDRAAVSEKLARFVLPYLDIRDRGNGYGVSIVKAGLEAVGRPIGTVRAPLENLGEKDLADLTALITSAGVSPAL
ncbi:putative 5-dehydro-4-deoxyglucarate dehydratase [Microbacterium sorbitolivorans]|uniref:Probable 5-dehydro-4-deoxyglucarate dehydratase n=1 Tax=Microbacterium sorbitolivorans TaxID=1867410 RepID=A0A367XYI1_9MICO|nr:5-dehydro-4-deoxyglucarate dehydratase [Microbacterium sorbitolivorans]RCK58705.1 5-dehydro-4-deoxyglucarate dehydratase [Microbacterium sorbitolivorans]GGF38713.1 putative 5-dehydro-4-deoxyglucarate dehydratase [Microbacterium sorbitolivorans]